MSARQTYRITELAGAYIAGYRRPPGPTIVLTPEEAEYDLRVGTIEPSGQPPTPAIPDRPLFEAGDLLRTLRLGGDRNIEPGDLEKYLVREGSTLAAFLGLRTAEIAAAIQASVEARLGEMVARNSPALTGTPTAPTAAAGTSTQQIATTGFVAVALAALVNSSPAALDTLNELAAALGNDPNFAATMAAALGNRVRFDAAQALTPEQVAQTLSNLGVSNFVRGLLDDPDAAAVRSALLLGSAALQDVSAFAAAVHPHAIADVTNLQGALDAKSPLASPSFTGTPSAPTAVAGTSSQQIATTGFVAAALAALVNSSPAALDTLNELAAALGNDPNFAATMAAALGNRVRFDAAQALTPAQVAQALTNLGVSSFVRGLLDDADAAAVRSTLLLGSAALQAASAFAAAIHGHAIADVTNLQGTLDAKAPLASPSFTGTPSAPTAAAGTSSQQIATTGFVAAALAGLVNSSPAALDTLNELAAALGNDPNFAATMAAGLGNRLRVDVAQGLTAAQIIQALSNLGVSSFARGLLDDADAAAARTTLGVREIIRANTGPAGISAGQTRYLGIGVVGTSQVNVWLVVGRRVRVRNLRVATPTAPGAGQTWAFTVQNLYTDTAVTCAMAGDVLNTANDLTNSAIFEVGDRLSVKMVASSGAVTTQSIAFSLDLEALD